MKFGGIGALGGGGFGRTVTGFGGPAFGYGIGMGMDNNGPTGRIANFSVNNIRIPATRVHLDARDASVRTTLATLFNQVRLDYAIDDDVTADLKGTFVFGNVFIVTALDTVCQSANVGWRVELVNEKPFVRVGRRYAVPSVQLPSPP